MIIKSRNEHKLYGAVVVLSIIDILLYLFQS
jgi:hypothetical protein